METTAFYRRNLPHWRVTDRPYFATFCLKGAMPAHIYNKLLREYEELKASSDTEDKTLSQWRIHFKKVDKILDSCTGVDYLRNPKIANVVLEALGWVENNYQWKIPHAVIMPNHVHCLMLGSNARTTLTKALKVLKGYTAREANKILQREGNFWISESFDHWLRNPDKTERAINYIRTNPVKAGLAKSPEDYPWLKGN